VSVRRLTVAAALQDPCNDEWGCVPRLHKVTLEVDPGCAHGLHRRHAVIDHVDEHLQDCGHDLGAARCAHAGPQPAPLLNTRLGVIIVTRVLPGTIEFGRPAAVKAVHVVVVAKTQSRGHHAVAIQV